MAPNKTKKIGKCRFAGDEPSPKGLGVCSKFKKPGDVMKGKDGNMWVVVVVNKDKKPYNRWVKKKTTSSTQKKKKTTTSSSSSQKKKKTTTSSSSSQKNNKNSYEYTFIVEPISVKFDPRRSTVLIKAKLQDQGLVMPKNAHDTLLAKEIIGTWKSKGLGLYDLNHYLDRQYSDDPYDVTLGASPWRVHSIKNAGKHVEVTLKTRSNEAAQKWKETLSKEFLTEVLSMEDVEDGYSFFTINTTVGRPTNVNSTVDENGKSIYFIDVVSKKFDQEQRTLKFCVMHGIHHKPRGSDDIVLPQFISMYEKSIPRMLDLHFGRVTWRPYRVEGRSPWKLEKVERKGEGIQITLKAADSVGNLETMYPTTVYDTFDAWLHDLAWLARKSDDP